MDLDTEKNKEKLLEALKEHRGLISYACTDSGISRSTYYVWMAIDPDFKKAVDEIADSQIDFVERALIRRIGEGSDSSIQFYLKTKGKKRGFQEVNKQEIELTTKDLKFNFGNLADEKQDDIDEQTDPNI